MSGRAVPADTASIRHGSLHMTPSHDTFEAAEPPRSWHGWYESSWDLMNGLEVRETALAELHSPGALPEPPSAT
jgi:hypothetical protein